MKISIVLVVASFLFTRSIIAEETHPKFDAAPLVSKLFRALRENDFESIYEMDFEMQLKAQQIRQDGPQFLVAKKLNEAKQTAREMYESRYSNYGNIINLARLDPVIEVTEIQPNPRYPLTHDVYVTLKFRSIESAPFRGDISNPEIINSTVLKLVFKDSGHFAMGERIVDVDTVFQNLPLKVIGMQIRPEFFLNMYVMGGTPPYKSKTTVAGYVFEQITSSEQNGHTIVLGRIDHNSQVNNTKLGFGAKDLPGSILITDSSGHKDFVTFILPNFSGDQIFWFLRTPWAEKGLHDQVGLFPGTKNVLPLKESAEQSDSSSKPNNTLSENSEIPFFELRIYHAAPGKLDDLNARFRDHTMELFKKHGMENIGYWMPLENTNNLLIYILAYPSREAREKSWKEFGADPDWKAVVKTSEANGKLVNKVDSKFLTATDYSPMAQPSQSGSARLFELRTYHASPGKLNDLHARFRDHTVELFKKHGMENFGYWTPTETKDGAGETLIYIVAHKDKAAADESWKEFRADADWNKAKKASEANGPLTVTDGVQSVYMAPTDYSPTK